MKQVLDFIKNNTNLSHDDYIVIGLSGGPDSMALLNILLDYKKEKGFNIVCAHVHHNIRKESDMEAEFVKEYCLNHDIIFEMKKLTYNTKFTEALGHKMRYEYFDTIIKKYNAKYLFTAHHGDDLIETILMRIVRGSTINGYSGFDYIVNKKDYVILRPLISVTKKDILNYLNKYNIPFVIDNSNSDENYTRNRYRKNILPVLKKEDENVHLKFLQYSNLLKEYNDYIEDEVDKFYDYVVYNNYIDLTKLKNYKSLLIKHIIYRWLSSIYKEDINLINSKHINSILHVIESLKPNIILYLPNYQLVKEYDKISLKKIQDIIDYEYILSDEVNLPNGKKIVKVPESDLTNNFVTYLDSSKIMLPLYVRNYRVGDKMTIKNMKGHKKIKDIFINEKILLQDRKNYPVVVDSSGEVIWLPGIKKSAFDNKNNEKYDIILEYH